VDDSSQEEQSAREIPERLRGVLHQRRNQEEGAGNYEQQA
jgi:hypothetical protein